MPHRRDIRRLAMQLLYQLDMRGPEDTEAIHEGLEGGCDSPPICEQAFALALTAWAQHSQADAMATQLAPKWPTHRQPPVDRAILRLAYHEMAEARAPVKVVINEAVELAKHYAAEHSPAFINGVLDKVARRMNHNSSSTEKQTMES